MSLRRYYGLIKCFDYWDEESVALMVRELCDLKIIQNLIVDNFGNFGNGILIKLYRRPYNMPVILRWLYF